MAASDAGRKKLKELGVKLKRPETFMPTNKDLMKLGRDMRDAIRKNIRKNPPPPLSIFTVERKGHNKAWIETKWLYKVGLATPSIRPVSKTKIHLFVMVSREIHPHAKIPAFKVFRYLEYGTRSIPARPVITPVEKAIQSNTFAPMLEFQTKFKRTVKERITN